MTVKKEIAKAILSNEDQVHLSLAIIDGLTETQGDEIPESTILYHLNLCQEIMFTATCLGMVLDGLLRLKISKENKYSFALTTKGERVAKEAENDEEKVV